MNIFPTVPSILLNLLLFRILISPSLCFPDEPYETNVILTVNEIYREYRSSRSRKAA